MKIKIIVHTVIFYKNKILFLKRASSVPNLPGYWDIPGGSLKDGEDPKMGAVREAFEETGLTIHDSKLIFSYSNTDKTKNMQFITMVYKSDIAKDDVKLAPKEHQEYRWITKEEAINFVKNNKTPDYLDGALKESLVE